MILSRDLRIVSLIASSTEIICALGLRNSLVGISHECDYPPDVKQLPVCTGPKFLPDGTSYEIDQKVKAILQESLSVYRVDASLLEELQPTHIITQSQCEVCAVSLRDVEEAACSLITSRPNICSLESNDLADVWSDIRKVGDATGIPDVASRLVESLQSRLADLRRRCEALAKPRVLFVEWIEPLMTGGNWMPELIEIAGGDNLFGEVGKHSPPLQWDAVLAADPEIIVVAPCGFDITRALQDMQFLTKMPRWNDLSAVAGKRVYIADGNQYFNRPGPRLVDSAEILAEAFHGGSQNYLGTGWLVFNADGDTAPQSDIRA